MDANKTAILLIGYQKDWFDPAGKLYGILEEAFKTTDILANTVKLVDATSATSVEIISTPLHFSATYFEADNPEGILKAIKEAGAFLDGETGSETIPDLEAFGDRIKTLPGKKGMNAFSNTELDSYLKAKGITNIVIAGAVTSLCVDTTARTAYGMGYQVTILTDCIAARSNVEQDFYCENIFPLYAQTIDSKQLVSKLQ